MQRFGALDGTASSRVVAPQLLYLLHSAVFSGRVDIVQLMLEKGYGEDLLDAEDATFGWPPLQIAADTGHTAMIFVSSSVLTQTPAIKVKLECRRSAWLLVEATLTSRG